MSSDETNRWLGLGREVLERAITPEDVTLGMSHLQRAFDGENAGAAYWLGLLYEPDGKFSNEIVESYRPRDLSRSSECYHRSLEWYRRDAQRGSAEALHSLANFYMLGLCVEADVGKALALLQESFDRGFLFAANDLYTLHADPNSSVFDQDKARVFLDVLERNQIRVVSVANTPHEHDF
jgi:TPR repeat protein